MIVYEEAATRHDLPDGITLEKGKVRYGYRLTVEELGQLGHKTVFVDPFVELVGESLGDLLYNIFCLLTVSRLTAFDSGEFAAVLQAAVDAKIEARRRVGIARVRAPRVK